MDAIALRPRSAIEIIDLAFRLCRTHYATLVAAVAIVVVPVMILKVALPSTAMPFVNVLERVVFPISDGAIVAIASKVYLGGTADLGDGLRAVRGRIGALIWVSLARNVLVVVGLIFFIVPGVFILASTFALPMAIIIERRAVGDAFTRSQSLAEADVWHVIRTVVLLLGMVLGLFIAGAITIRLLTGEISSIPLELLRDALLIALYPVTATGATLLYYDMRIRKEGFDLEMMGLGMAAAPHVPASVSAAESPTGG